MINLLHLDETGMARVLVTGGSGLLGSRIVEALSGEDKVFYTFNRNRAKIGLGTPVQLDVSSRQSLKKIAAIRPEIVFHTAAVTNVDYCESNREEAFAVNVEGARHVALACREANAKMVHLSTDYVFDGKRGDYSEDDKPNPINYYGLTKLESEKIVASVLEEFAIARTTVIFGWNRKWQKKRNFATWVVQSLRGGKTVPLVTDQFSSPTLAENLADALVELASGGKRGTYNVVGNDCLSRFEFGLEIADAFCLDPGLIKPVKSEELGQAAPRPKRNCLSNKKATKELKTGLLGVKDALSVMKRQEELDKG